MLTWRWLTVLALSAACSSRHDGNAAPTDLAMAVAVDQAITLDATSVDSMTADAATVGPAPALRISVDAIPDYMNGKQGYSDGSGHHDFRLRVPTSGFNVDFYVAGGATDGGVALEPASFDGAIELTASVDLSLGGKTFAAGQNLRSALVCTTQPDVQGWPEEARSLGHCAIPADAFTLGTNSVITVELTGKLIGSEGEPTTDSITVDVAPLPDNLNPFVHAQRWLVTFDRDIFDHALTKNPDGSYNVAATYVPTGNGKADFQEALEMLGLASSNATVSAAFRADLLQRVRTQAQRIYGLDTNSAPTSEGAQITIYYQGDVGAPTTADFTPTGDLSMIAVGGDPNPDGIAMKYVGRATIDANNQGVEDDTGYGDGIFTTSMVRQILANPLGALLVQEFSPLDGTPLGLYAGDELIVDPNFSPSSTTDTRLKTRAAQLATIRQYLPMALASTLCHEMGHSMGLVANGAPPLGLFGGMDGLNFTKSDAGPWHIDTPGLNVMQTGRVTDYAEVLAGEIPRFNQLNMAYFRRRLIIGVTP